MKQDITQDIKKMKTNKIFFSFDIKNNHDKAIKNNDGFNYNHCGIILDNNQTLEATSKEGVIISNLDKYDNYHIYKVEKEEEINIKEYLNEPYDHLYLGKKGYYCSNLVNKIFNLIKEHPLVFEDKKYWQEYYQKYNMDIPDNILGTNPNSLSKSKKIKRIK